MRIYRSPRGSIDIPKLDLLTLLFDSPWGQAEESCKIHVDAESPENYITKAEARHLVKQVAYVLREDFGVGASGAGKDVVLTMMSGSPFAPIVFYGIVAAGGIFCGASMESQSGELIRQAQDGASRLLVGSPECQEKLLSVAKECGISTERVLVMDASSRKWRLTAMSNGQCRLARAGGKQLDWPRITDQALLEETTTCLLFSSGTTGLPKGVRVSHYGLVANNVCTMDPAVRYKEKCRREGRSFSFDTIAHLPMANIAGISLYSTNPFYMGGTTYWMRKYVFEDFIKYHRRYRPAYQFTVPPIWLRIAKSDDITDHFDGLQVGVTGSAPIGEGTMRAVQRKLGKGRALIAQTWGTTETSGVITALDWSAFNDKGIWSVGELCPNVDLRIVDDHDADVKDGKPGEFLIRGPILSQGYHNRPQETSETFVDGWYRSGDVGVCINNQVYIQDRKKEMIKVKGAQVAPAELEAVLNSHQNIADAAVIGVWSELQQTEVPRAYIVRKGDTTAADVANHVKAKVAGYKQLRGGVFFIDEIPKSASGKILRKVLRERALAESSIKARM
ncbi:putative acyl-coenzyme A synthetase [Pseudocercospora fuligena]|uniref:Putative acyl-coenzyme A synthetase n=1 Tax=Pseudocercospora fuligena TaxID=685502 RepID=A0A8H6VGW1_9PEZI|nr:putative acyl-coenzyme A synthetase [Pseudocercospora fuligena]